MPLLYCGFSVDIGQHAPDEQISPVETSKRGGLHVIMLEVGDIMWLQNSTLRSWLHTGILVIDTAQGWAFPGLVHLQDDSYQ